MNSSKRPQQLGLIEATMIAVKHGRPMENRPGVRAIEDRGFEGCRHQRMGSRRQVLIIDRATLNAFKLQPGQLKENLTVIGLDVNKLPAGARLACGDEAVLEITGPCEPCASMEKIREGLRAALDNRRGVLCRVLKGGLIRPGDAMTVLEVAAE